VTQKFSRVELVESLFDLLSEPGIVVQIMFYKLFDISLGIAIVFGGCLLDFCLQFWREMDFHISTIGIQRAHVNADLQNST
jgi:hypothetical protein